MLFSTLACWIQLTIATHCLAGGRPKRSGRGRNDLVTLCITNRSMVEFVTSSFCSYTYMNCKLIHAPIRAAEGSSCSAATILGTYIVPLPGSATYFCRLVDESTLSSSTSKTRSELGGIARPAPKTVRHNGR